jgi:hypothetical protein
MNYYVFLDDGETYSGLEGCVIIGIADGNEAAIEALNNDEFSEVRDLADSVTAVPKPSE